MRSLHWDSAIPSGGRSTGTGQLYAGDVGQGAREEIDIITNGGNYGWRVFEGTLCTNNDPGLCIPANFIPPIAEYDHAAGRCAIIGGHVYRGTTGALPAGAYVYGDLCTGEIFSSFRPPAAVHKACCWTRP